MKPTPKSERKALLKEYFLNASLLALLHEVARETRRLRKAEARARAVAPAA